MSASSFRSVFMVASCATAALGCYLVSLRVASERAALEDVENKIVLAQRDLRVLQTEIGTRGRLAQLERWNVKVLALSAPSADQFLAGSFELAKMTAPQNHVDLEAPVVLASAPAKPQPKALDTPVDPAVVPAAPASASGPAALLRQASLKVPERAAKVETATRAAPVKAAPAKTAAEPAKPIKDAKAPVAKADKKSVDKAAKATPAPLTKPVKIAKADPLAPLPAATAKTTPKDPAKKK